MKQFGNSRKDSFLDSIPKASIEAEGDVLTVKCKFNFAYFDVQAAGQSFDQWSADERLELLTKLKDYSKESLEYWRTRPIGKSGTVLAIYEKFPNSSKFFHPKHVPHEAHWGRFRLDHSGRMVGFVIPKKFDGVTHPKTKRPYDCNTFYVVFLDKNHDFYLGKDK